MTQVWNSDDAFSDLGLTQASSYLDHIVRHQPWSSDPAYVSGGTGFSYDAATFGTRSQLYTGWFGQQAPPYIMGSSLSPATCSSGSITNLAPKPIAFWRRGTLASEVRVAASFQVQSTDANYIRTNGVTFMVGVGARILPGANTSPTDPNLCATAPGSGYWLVAIHDTTPGRGTKFTLVRVVAGVVSRLAETPVGQGTFSAWATTTSPSNSFWRPQMIEIVVEDEDGDVRVKAYTTRMGVSPQNGGGRNLLFNILDSSASKLTSAGVTGLICGSEYILTPSPQRLAAPCVNYWTATSPDSTVTYFRDEWSRTKHSLGLSRSTVTTTDKAHFLGYALTTGWAGDTQTGLAVGPWLTLDTTNDRVTVPATSKPPSVLSMRPATDARNQDRSAVFRFTSTGSATATERYAGIGLRGTIASGSTAAFSAGYIARIYYRDDTSGVRITVARVVDSGGAGVETVIAEAASPFAFALDTDITLRFKVQTLPVPDPVNGYARMSVYVDAVQVVLVAPTTPAAGVEFSAAGTVTDTATSRVLAGLGEALYVWAPTGTRTITFDTWSEEAEAVANEVAPHDQASIAVGGEYGTTIALELPTNLVATVRYVDPRISHVMESRHEYLGRALGYARRIWTVTATLTEAQKNTLVYQLLAARGSEGAFTWTPPGYNAAEVVVHVVPDSVEIDKVAPSVYTTRMELQELRLADA